MKLYKTKNMNLQLFAGETITDLTGTSWEFNNNLNIPNYFDATPFSINFISNENNYSLIKFEIIANTDMFYDSTRVYRNNWLNNLYRTILITGGTDTTNSTLISWLQSNATQIQTGYDSTISLTNCTCNKSSESGLTGSYTATITANDGYYLSSVTNTLGTVTIAENKKTATIEISDVTEDFTISGIGTEIGKLDIILHPNNNGVTDYTKEILPKVKTASTLDINRLFRTEYTITKTIINGSASGDTNIWSEETAQVTITPDENYNLPSTITVTNANNTYNNENGIVNLSNATGNVTISATCESAAWGGTDLTGTTWEFNSSLVLTNTFNYSLNFNYNFNDEITNSVNLQCYEFKSVLTLSYSGLDVYIYDDDYWYNQDFRTISITGGTDATNTNLISWLQANATLLSW